MINRNNDWLWLALAGILGGLLGGVIFALGGRFIGSGNASGWGDLIGTAVGFMLGIPVGVTLGIGFVGYKQGHGRTLLLIIPSVAVSAILVMLLAEPLHLNAAPQLLFGALIVVPSLVTATLLHRQRSTKHTA